jgi:hypothetical protein
MATPQDYDALDLKRGEKHPTINQERKLDFKRKYMSLMNDLIADVKTLEQCLQELEDFE